MGSLVVLGHGVTGVAQCKCLLVQEQWCKKAPPTHEMILRYVMQPPFPSDPPRAPPADKEQVPYLVTL